MTIIIIIIILFGIIWHSQWPCVIQMTQKYDDLILTDDDIK